MPIPDKGEWGWTYPETKTAKIQKLFPEKFVVGIMWSIVVNCQCSGQKPR